MDHDVVRTLSRHVTAGRGVDRWSGAVNQSPFVVGIFANERWPMSCTSMVDGLPLWTKSQAKDCSLNGSPIRSTWTV